MELLRKTAAWRSQLLRREMLEGVARLSCGAVAALAVMLWSDQAFSLEQTVRWAAFGSGLAALGWYVFRLLARPWLEFRWSAVLDEAAREFPELQGYLKPAWELRLQGEGRHTSQALRQAHLELTESLLRRLPQRPLFRWRPSKQARRTAMAAAFGVVSMPWLAQSPSWERVLAPWKDIPLERYIQIIPGDAQTQWGANAKIEARWQPSAPSGRDRRELKLWLEDAGGWKAARWDTMNEQEAVFTAEGLSAPLRYRLSWRDLETRSYRLTPVALPEMESLTATISGPDPVVVALSAAEPLSVLRGSLITISGKPNQALAEARLRVSSLPTPIPMKVLSSGEYAASLVAQEDAALHFELQSIDGRTNPEPATYGLKVLPDMPPKIELLSPVEPLAASPQDTISITYSASDDGGLIRISLLVRAKGLPQREVVLQRFQGRREFLGDYSWELAGLPFGKLEFQLKAVDNALPPQSSLSAVGTVELVDFAAGHADAQALWDKTEDNLKALAAKEDDVRAKLAQAENAPLENDLAELSQQWRQSAGQFSQWQRAMEKDAYANPGLNEAAREQSASLQEAAQRDLPEAVKASQTGDVPGAQKKHAQLASRLRQAQKLLSEGRTLQGLQDFYNQAGRMDQASSDMQSQLESLAQNGKADKEALSKLKSGLDKLQKQMEALQKAMQALPEADPDSAESKSRKTYEMPLGEARDQADALSKALARGDYAAAAEIARQLSESLEKIQKALGEAASDAASSSQARQASAALSKAQAQWSQVVEEQTRVLEKTQALGRKRLDAKVSGQKDMIADLARRQSALASSAAEAGQAFPMDALSQMKAVQAELDSGKVSHAPGWLKGVSARLRMEPQERWESYAASEDDIRQKLEEGPSLPAEAPSPESQAAGHAQSQVRSQTHDLQKQLESIDQDTGALPSEVMQKVEAAQGEQSAAESALGQGQSGQAQGHEEQALSLLSQGSKAMSQAMGGQQSMQMGMGQPFSRPGGGAFRLGSGGSGNGAQLGFVPLPSTKDYLPPQDIRDELKKSLQESRPASYDRLIKEYFKRISQ
jgi:tetratricopeptide (TPR) repeat protein